MSWLKRLFDGCKRLASAIGRFVTGRSLPSGAARVAFWVLVAVLLVGVLIGLWWVNRTLRLPEILWTPGPLGPLAEFWLPMLFLLGMALLYLGRQLWLLLGPEPLSGVFPDIDQAWEEAMVALDRAGLSPAELPVFLVLGRPAAGDRFFLEASERPWRVRQAPRRPDAPIHVSADDEGIYVFCPGTSYLAAQAERLADRSSAVRSVAARTPVEARAAVGNSSRDHSNAATPAYLPTQSDLPTLGALADEAPPAATSPAQRPQSRAHPSFQDDDGSSFEVTAADSDFDDSEHELETPPGQASVFGGPGRPQDFDDSERHDSLLRDPAELERIGARLRHVCERIAQSRRPYCPLNGVAVLLPMSATDTDTDTRDTAALCHRDLEVLRETFQLRFPVFAIVCDLESLPGCRDLLGRLPRDAKRQLFGRSLPLVPDLNATERLELIERGTSWMSNVLLPSFVYRLLRIESPDGQESADRVLASNVRLVQFQVEFRRRQRRLGRLLTRGIVLQASDPVMLGGCYLSATGFDPNRERGFVPGLFRLLIEHQNYVAWSPRILAEEVHLRRWTVGANLAVGLALLTLLAFVGYLIALS